MADRDDPVDAAYGRMAILKAIVADERSRAERDPFGERNVELGITAQDQPHGEVRARIGTLFNELEVLLDHLTVFHMAASFEMAAKARVDDAVDAARTLLKESRRLRQGWHQSLIRDPKGMRGLHAIGQVLGLSGTDQQRFNAIGSARNLVAHGISLDTGPPIAAEDVRAVLVETLARLR